jgi:hypothetical protein
MTEKSEADQASRETWLRRVEQRAEREARAARLKSKHSSALSAAKLLESALGRKDIKQEPLEANSHPDYQATRQNRDIFGGIKLRGSWRNNNIFPRGFVHLERVIIYGVPRRSSPKWVEGALQQPEIEVDGRIVICHSDWEEDDPRTPWINSIYPGGYDARSDDIFGFCLGLAQIAHAKRVALPLPDINESR